MKALDVGGFDTSKVADMSSMFQDCLRLKALDFSGFDTSSVESMSDMVEGCDALVQLTAGPEMNLTDSGLSQVPGRS